jgi:hypothetical protein
MQSPRETIGGSVNPAAVIPGNGRKALPQLKVNHSNELLDKLVFAFDLEATSSLHKTSPSPVQVST